MIPQFSKVTNPGVFNEVCSLFEGISFSGELISHPKDIEKRASRSHCSPPGPTCPTGRALPPGDSQWCSLLQDHLGLRSGPMLKGLLVSLVSSARESVAVRFSFLDNLGPPQCRIMF